MVKCQSPLQELEQGRHSWPYPLLHQAKGELVYMWKVVILTLIIIIIVSMTFSTMNMKAAKGLYCNITCLLLVLVLVVLMFFH